MAGCRGACTKTGGGLGDLFVDARAANATWEGDRLYLAPEDLFHARQASQQLPVIPGALVILRSHFIHNMPENFECGVVGTGAGVPKFALPIQLSGCVAKSGKSQGNQRVIAVVAVIDKANIGSALQPGGRASTGDARAFDG